MKKKYITIIIVIVAIGGFLLLARVITGEDVWLCVNGSWQKHGQPSSQMPTSGCGNEQIEENINTNSGISSFEECIEAGNLIQESYPRRCTADDGASFTEDIGNELDKQDIIKITSPRPNEKIASPLVIIGEAKGTWYFEGIFSIKLFDEDNNIIATANAQSQEDWMSEDFVSYKATLEFTAPSEGKGSLILEKSNPSGLNQNADQLVVPITF
ncbi:MAG: Gmad2 immunoglobulin-like domain-containing protein [Patescibacteria group bacterium]